MSLSLEKRERGEGEGWRGRVEGGGRRGEGEGRGGRMEGGGGRVEGEGWS